MRILYREGFPVPEPLAWSRHTVVMEFIDSFPLRMIDSVPDPGKLYAELMEMIVRLARRGLIHGDFNEFNLLIKEETKGDKPVLKPILIDFPQTVSTNHANAKFYFDRDVACVKRYFERRFKYTSDEPGPHFADAIKDVDPEQRLDIEVEASGFSKKMGKELERYVEAVGGDQSEADGEASYEDHEDDDEDGDSADENDLEAEGDEAELENCSAGVDGSSLDDGGVAVEAPTIDKGLTSAATELSLHADGTAKPFNSTNFGLVPFELPQDEEAVTEKARTKKKASGWAI